MDGGGVGGVHAEVDPGGGRRVVQGLQPNDVAELGLQQAVDAVDGELPVGAEDVEVTGQHQVLILVAGEAAPLEVDDQRLHHQEVSPQDGLFDVDDL